MIKVYKSTAKNLKSFKLTNTETYDEILNRMIEHFNSDGKLKKGVSEK